MISQRNYLELYQPTNSLVDIVGSLCRCGLNSSYAWQPNFLVDGESFCNITVKVIFVENNAQRRRILYSHASTLALVGHHLLSGKQDSSSGERNTYGVACVTEETDHALLDMRVGVTMTLLVSGNCQMLKLHTASIVAMAESPFQ